MPFAAGVRFFADLSLTYRPNVEPTVTQRVARVNEMTASWNFPIQKKLANSVTDGLPSGSHRYELTSSITAERAPPESGRQSEDSQGSRDNLARCRCSGHAVQSDRNPSISG